MKKIWLTRNLILLTMVSLAQDAASELLYPLLPILLTGVIGAAPLALGLIEGCAEAAAGFTKLISGKSSDRLGRKPFVVSGYTLAGVGKALVVVATSWPLVFLGRVTDRIGKGMRSAPRDALISDSVDKAHLGKAFGFHRTGDNIGAVIGPGIALIGLAMLDGDVRAVAMWALIPAIISGLLTLFIRENFVKPKKIEAKVTVKHPPLPAPLKRSITILVLIQLTNIPDALLLLRLYDIGFSTQSVVLSYMLFSGVTVLAAYPGGAIADRYSPKIVYAVGLMAFAAAYATLGLTQNHTTAIVALAFYGLFPALTDGVGKAWIAGLSEATHRGRAQGVYQASMNFAILGAGIWGGALWSKGDIQWPLIVAAIGAFIGAIVLATGHLRRARS
ncbi:MFS transporter [Actinomycetes bacterium]|nr:MFS transporter [Actinomycetes bacterium]